MVSSRSAYLQVMIAGGSSEYCANTMTAGAAQSISFDATPGADHSLVIEKINFPRVVRILRNLQMVMPSFWQAMLSSLLPIALCSLMGLSMDSHQARRNADQGSGQGQ